MAYSKETMALISILEDRIVAYHPRLAKVLGGVQAALWMSQLMYWTGKSTQHQDGWVEKVAADFEEETGLTTKQQETVRSTCINKGFVRIERRGLPGMPCYKINYDALASAIVKYNETSSENSGKNDPTVTSKRRSYLPPDSRVLATPKEGGSLSSEITYNSKKDSAIAPVAIATEFLSTESTDTKPMNTDASAEGTLDFMGAPESEQVVPPVDKPVAQPKQKSFNTSLINSYKDTVIELLLCTTNLTDSSRVCRELVGMKTDEVEVQAAIIHCRKGFAEWKPQNSNGCKVIPFSKVPEYVKVYRGYIAKKNGEEMLIPGAPVYDFIDCLDAGGNPAVRRVLRVQS